MYRSDRYRRFAKECLELSRTAISEQSKAALFQIAFRLLAAMILLSTGFVLYPESPANAAKFCAQLRGTTAMGHPDCSFSTLDACRARVRHRGGGHCYRMH
jgi:hypothetical protein